MKTWMMVVAVVVCSVAARASAEAPPEAKVLFQHAVELFSRGDVRGAQEDFERVLPLYRSVAVVFNLGLVYAELGDSARAVALLDEVLANPKLPAARRAKAQAVRATNAARLAEVAVIVPVEGAAVQVNGQAVGQSPLPKAVKVNAGQVLIGAEAPRHIPAHSSVTVAPGAKTEVRLDLMPLDRAPAQLTVRSATPLAELYVDGVLVARAPFFTSVALEAGSRQLELRREGFRSQLQTLTLAEGGTGEWQVDLDEDPVVAERRGGTLRASAGEGAIDVTVDGRRRGVLTELKLVPGVHLVRFERGGFFPEVREITVRPLETTTVELTFSPTPELRASLSKDRAFYRTLGTSSLIGGAVVAAASGVYLAYTAISIDQLDQRIAYLSTFRTTNDCPGDNGTTVHCEPLIEAATDERNKARGYLPIGVIGAAVGVVALGVGVWAMLMAPDPNRYDRPKSTTLIDDLALVPMPGGGLFALSGHF